MQRHLPSHSFGRLWHTALAAFAVDVSQAVHPLLQRAEHELSRRGSDAAKPEIGLRAADPALQQRSSLSRARGSRPRRPQSAAPSCSSRSRRNTAPAIAVAALLALKDNPDAILAVMPSDHVVKDEARFVEGVKRAAEVAATGKLVLFGIKPTEPHTGYGYIKQGAALPGLQRHGLRASRASPKSPTAPPPKPTVETGSYFWNSGIFVLSAKTYLEEIAAPRAEDSRSGAHGASRTRRKTWASCASTRPALPPLPIFRSTTP